MINKLNHNIKMFTKVMTFLMILNLVNFVNGIKCTNVAKNRTFHSMECTDVTSMHELTSAMKSTWTSLRIINPIGSSFAISEHVNRNLGIIQDLDLSSAGSVLIGDNFGFREFSALQHINLSNSKLAGINNNWFATQNNILTLNLSYNRISSLTRQNFNTLTNLKTLDLSYNFLNTIQLAFIQLINLEWLSLNHNQLQELVDMGDLPMLKYLDLSENAIAEVPSNTFATFQKLEVLTIAQNSILTLEEYSFTGLDQIISINVSGNRVEQISNKLFVGYSRIKIRTLDFDSNNIVVIQPQSFIELRHLYSLILSGNSIKELNAETFRGLSGLRKLYLNENDILNIQKDTFTPLINLEDLDLSGNNLQTLSGDVFGDSLLRIRRLFVKSNDLLVVQPNTFLNLPNLEYLSLAFNEIRTLDENLFEPLNRLKKLHLGHNQIENLPTKLFSRTYQLSEILIHNNRITFFPGVDNDFPRLQRISIDGNPWQCPCLFEILEFATARGITYRPENISDDKHYNGKKPICVVTPTKACVKDYDIVREHHIAEFYDSA